MFKQQLKIFQRACARYGLYVFSGMLKWLPYGSVGVLKAILIPIAFALTIRQKKIARESLGIAFGDTKSQEEINAITKKCFQNVGEGMLEMFYFLSHPEIVPSKVTVEGKEHLDNALKKGKGVIAVTAHFGNFPLMMLYCALKGYKTNSIIRRTRDEKLEAYLFRKRTESGLNTVYTKPRTKCIEDSLRVLNNNEILFIPLDQNFGSQHGIFVDFFGQKAATATGPVVFARRTGAPIIPMFVIRDRADQHKILIESPLDLEEGKDDRETMYINTSKITQVIESYIRRYPHEWGWMHRRWKTQPLDQLANTEEQQDSIA